MYIQYMLSPARPTYYLFFWRAACAEKKNNPRLPPPSDLCVFWSATGRAKMTNRNLPRVPSRSAIGLQARPAEPPLELGSTASEDVATIGKRPFICFKSNLVSASKLHIFILKQFVPALDLLPS